MASKCGILSLVHLVGCQYGSMVEIPFQQLYWIILCYCAVCVNWCNKLWLLQN